MSPDPVTYERHGPAAVVTIDRQERRNAVDGPTAELLGAAYERFEAEEDARVLVLTGAGGVAFCAGADLKAIDTFGPRLFSDEGPLGFTRRIASKPTIAAIEGIGMTFEEGLRFEASAALEVFEVAQRGAARFAAGEGRGAAGAGA